MKNHINFLLLLFSTVLFSQEIIFPESFIIDSDVLEHYSLPEDIGSPNPSLIENANNINTEGVFSIQAKRIYYMVFIKNMEELIESNKIEGNEDFLLITVSELSTEYIEDLLKNSSHLTNDNDDSILLVVDKYAILIQYAKSNKNDAEKLADYYKNKVGAMIISLGSK